MVFECRGLTIHGLLYHMLHDLIVTSDCTVSIFMGDSAPGAHMVPIPLS